MIEERRCIQTVFRCNAGQQQSGFVVVLNSQAVSAGFHRGDSVFAEDRNRFEIEKQRHVECEMRQF